MHPRMPIPRCLRRDSVSIAGQISLLSTMLHQPGVSVLGVELRDLFNKFPYVNLCHLHKKAVFCALKASAGNNIYNTYLYVL
jgi:hypothetical protein